VNRLESVKIQFLERQPTVNNKDNVVMFDHDDLDHFRRNYLDLKRDFLIVFIVVKGPVFCWG
jgi:hypothetical protein